MFWIRSLLAVLLIQSTALASVTFTGARQFSTPNNTIFTNVPQATQSFKFRLESNTANIPSETSFNAKTIFGFWHSINPTAAGSVTVKFSLGGINGMTQYIATFKSGTLYHVVCEWDGVTGNHFIWINGVKSQFYTIVKGNLSTRIDPLTLGITPNIPISYTIDDQCIWHNRLLTQAEIFNLYHNGTPDAPTARWTFSGPKGQAVAANDSGMKNSLGSGPDYSAVTGIGTAVYNDPLVYTPVVNVDRAYVATSGKIIVIWLKGTTPTGVVNPPTMTINGTNYGPLEKLWFTGYPFLFYSTPGNYQIQPGDLVTLDAPVSWAATPIGDTLALTAFPIENRTGRSVFDYGNKTLRLGMNNPQAPESSNLGFYHPLKNLKYKFGVPGISGIANQSWSAVLSSYHGVNNGVDNTFYPGVSGQWLVMWDGPATTTFDLTTGHPEYTSIVENTTLATPNCRVFNITSLPGATTPNLDVVLRVTGSPPNYSNLWVCLPGDWDIINGKAYVNRSDPFALSKYYLDRMTQNVGSMRWVDSSPVGGNPGSFQYPEYLMKATDENWGDLGGKGWLYGITNIGPVDPVKTPYIYSPFFKNGIYTVQLAKAISDTDKLISISGDQVFTGLEITADNEVMRVREIVANNIPITDPSFEAVQLPAGLFQYRPTNTAWTYTGNAILMANTTPWGNPPAPSGNMATVLQGTDAQISESITVNGGNYTLSFYAAQRTNNQQDFQVLLDGTVIGTFKPTSSSYVKYSTTFTATGIHTLTFKGINTVGGDNSVFIDAVSISDGISFLVNRGSSGTTPAAHAAGDVKVSGRLPINVGADGTVANGTVIAVTTASPHTMTTGNVCSWMSPAITLTTGEVTQFVPRAVYVTGPNTFYEIYGGKGGKPTQTTTYTNQTWDKRTNAGIPHEVCASITGRFPKANLWINIWPDATDDLVYEIAGRIKNNFPAGRKVYVEYNNEPWNWMFSGFYYHSMMAIGDTDHTFLLSNYIKRALEVHAIFRTVFAERANEIVGIANCQMGSGDAENYLKYAKDRGLQLDAIAVAPYVSMTDSPYNAKLFDSYDDEQVIDMYIHDLHFSPGYPNNAMTIVKAAIAKYNPNCLLLGYEGGIEYVPPTSAANRERRNHDLQYNPNWYVAEQDFYFWVQKSGFDMLQVYSHAMFWSGAGWGQYHSITQPHGYGDGSTASDGYRHLNKAFLMGIKGANVNQDANCCSIRGQAFIDWLNGFKATYPSRN